jgi:hypothetical protein
MPQNLQLVFSDPGDDVSDEEFDRWYEAHLDEILAVPGFQAAQRYRLNAQVVDPSTSVPQRRLVMYEVDRSPAELRAEMERMNLLDAASYERLKTDASDTGPPLPTWWPRVRFAAWNLIPIGERLEASETT